MMRSNQAAGRNRAKVDIGTTLAFLGSPRLSQTSPQCTRQVLNQPVVMEGCRRDAKPLGTSRYGRIVDRLDINAIPLQQEC